MSGLPEQSADDLLATFITALEKLHTSANQANIDGLSLQQEFLAIQQLYQQQLLPTLMAADSAAPLMTYQTEINRSLRLLGVDVTFLQTAKNSITRQKRQVQMQQRLKTLLDFSRGLREQLKKNSTPFGKQPDSGELE